MKMEDYFIDPYEIFIEKNLISLKETMKIVKTNQNIKVIGMTLKLLAILAAGNSKTTQVTEKIYILFV
jgi:hypothetical protein